MPSIEVKIWLALKSRVDSISLSFPIAYPGVPFTPPHGNNGLGPYLRAGHKNGLEPFLRVGRITVAPIRRYIDSGQPHERTGSLIVTLVHPMNQPVVATYDQYAGIIAEHFKDGTCMEHNGIAVSIPSYPHVQEGYEDNGYWTVPVRIPWRCFA